MPCPFGRHCQVDRHEHHQKCLRRLLATIAVVTIAVSPARAQQQKPNILAFVIASVGLIMGLDPVLLSRLPFAFVIFPVFTIGLAVWLATIEGARLATGNAVYR